MSEDQDLFTQAMQAADQAASALEAAQPKDEGVPADPLSEAPVTTAEESATPARVDAPVDHTAPSPSPIASERFAPRLTKLMEREAATVAREQKLKELEAKYASFETKMADLESARSRFLSNPTDYLRKLAPEMKPADLAKALWYEELGDAAPVEHRVARTERAAKQTVEELRAEIEQERKRTAEAQNNAAMEAAHHQYVGALNSIAVAVPEQYPLVKAFSQQDPDRVTRGLYRMAQKHARATNGEVATPTQCAEMLQKELASLQGVFTPQPAKAAAPAVKPAAEANTPSSLRNKHTSVQPNKTQAETEEELFQEAMKAAQAARPSV